MLDSRRAIHRAQEIPSMIRAKLRVTLAACGLVVIGFAAAAHAQPTPTQPFAPDWGMLAGWDVFTKKSCGQCHSVRGVGGKVGPDLARVQSGSGFYQLGAAMWNHLPRMGERMRAERVDRPALTAADVSNLLAFLFTAAYRDESGDPKSGEQVFAAKGCVQCHAVGGKGGSVGPSLDALKGANSPVLIAAAMWNHGPRMAEVMKAKGIERPTFKDRELVDVIAYVVSTARAADAPTAQVIPGTPERGEKLFAEKRCATCHAVGGKGGNVGPALGGRAHHVSLTDFAALMWNHGPAMWAKMKERGIDVPQLTGQDMADVVAYLYTSHYFDALAGQASRGRQLVQTKGCVRCHSVRGKGGTVSADFATSTVVGSPSGVIAAMWNHGPRMEGQAQKQEISLPVLTGQELADITAYLGSLTRTRSPAKKAK
jgi:mono/diheme cytochrome c family protein